MANDSLTVLLMTSAIGQMMADPESCPKNVTQDDIMNFFTGIINEQNESYKLKHSHLAEMTRDIKSYFDDVTSNKNTLIREESAEAVADIVSAAATIAAEAGSWIPLINFGLAAAAVAATAAALGLEIASEKLEKTVVEEISNADTQIINKYQSFKNIKLYSASVTANNHFYPKFQLVTTINQMRALFLSVVVVIKKTNNGKCTAQDMKQAFLNFYKATEADKELVKKFAKILQQLQEKGSDPEKFKQDIAAFFQPLSSTIVRSYASVMLGYSIMSAIKHGRTAYKAYKAARTAMTAAGIEMVELDEDGNSVENAAPEAELADTIGVAEKALMAAGVLASIASVVFGALEIKKAVDTDKKLTQAIADAKTGIIDYYKVLVTRTIDG